MVRSLGEILSPIYSSLGQSGPTSGVWLMVKGLAGHVAVPGLATATRRKQGRNSGRQLLEGEAGRKNSQNFIGNKTGLFGKGVEMIPVIHRA